MEICSGTLRDNSRIMKDLADLHPNPGDMVCVKVNLPEYVDITSMLALQRRMVQVAETGNVVLRLLGTTTNPVVEKYATRLFAERDDIFITIDWRAES